MFICQSHQNRFSIGLFYLTNSNKLDIGVGVGKEGGVRVCLNLTHSTGLDIEDGWVYEGIKVFEKHNLFIKFKYPVQD
jgi:hypothetical protein